MHVLPSEAVAIRPIDTALRHGLAERIASDRRALEILPLMAVLTAFWIYVTLSNVLYAHSMQASLGAMSPQHLFAPWLPRVLQHLFLYPILLGCVWASLHIGWQPGWRKTPLQLLLGLVFSVLAAPALLVGERIHGTPEIQDHSWPVGAVQFLAGVESSMWLASATNFFLTYGFALALITGLALYQRFRDSELRFAALERALGATRLSALRMQLSPHTLFNLLHTIRGQIAWDPHSAQAMVVQLGDVLRRLLAAGEREFSRLADELKFVHLYLELQQSRFPDRLTVDIADHAQLPALWVPSLILQPLVENAVAHGLAGHTGPVEIRVEAVASDDNLTLRVINTMAAGALLGADGIGLRNVRERLLLQFGARATFHAGATGASSWMAEICMPTVGDALDAGRATRTGN